MTSRTRVGGNGEKTTQLIRRLLNVLASNLEDFDLQLEAYGKAPPFHPDILTNLVSQEHMTPLKVLDQETVKSR